MSEIIRYGDLAFDHAFLSCRRDGEEVRFTRQERALLQVFTRHPRTLLTRDRLLLAMSGAGAETSDRNIDYLVNRLRTKLGDRARDPLFIATQYGEGYLWIADPADSVAADTFCVIGPVFGFKGSAGAKAFLERLRAALDRRTTAKQRVVLAPDWRPEHAGLHKVRFHLEVGLHERGGALHAATVLRDLPARRILHTFRLALTADDAALRADDLAASLQSRIWTHLAGALDAPAALTDEPLDLRLHNAALLLSRSDQSWMESGAQLAQARRDNPADPKIALMWGCHLLARLTLGGFLLDADAREAIDSEIESVALDALPRIAGDPIFTLAAARLLFAVDRGHFELAEQLAEQAFAESVAFAATFALLGQLRMCKGEIDEAVDFYDRGIELAEWGSEFHVFLLVLKCAAFAAADDRPQLDATLAALYAIKPATRMQIGILFPRSTPADMDADHAEHLDMGGVVQARHRLAYFHFMGGRHFQQEVHRANLLRGLVSQTVRRFGADAVPGAIWSAAPSLASLAD